MSAEAMYKWVMENSKTENTYYTVIKWCKEHIKEADLKDHNVFRLFEMATMFLMRFKIGKWNATDALVVIHFLALKYAYLNKIDDIMQIEILEEGEYQKQFKCGSANCRRAELGYKLTYSSRVVNHLCSNSYERFLRGLQIIYHEVVHVLQNTVIMNTYLKGAEIPYTKTMYIMALETITRMVDPKFYDANYKYLLKENHAEKQGLIEAMKTLQRYNPKLYEAYNKESIQRKINSYDQNFYDAKLQVLQNGGEAIKQIDLASCLFFEKYPEELEKYPVLKLGFHSDGSKKNVIELLQERALLLSGNRKKEEIDELYETIANQKNFVAGGLKGSKDEILNLDKYIREIGTDDEFVFDLLRFRLQKSSMNREAIESFINQEKQASFKVRQARENKVGIM